MDENEGKAVHAASIINTLPADLLIENEALKKFVELLGQNQQEVIFNYLYMKGHR